MKNSDVCFKKNNGDRVYLVEAVPAESESAVTEINMRDIFLLIALHKTSPL